MATVTTHDGAPAVVIPDSRGREWTYLVAVRRAGNETTYTLTCLGRPDDPRHAVTRRAGGWRCGCRAFRFRAGLVEGCCKHIIAVRELVEFLRLLKD